VGPKTVHASRKSASAWVPDLVAAAGPRATDAYIEFFTATIRNRNTRLAYARACYQFFQKVSFRSSFAHASSLQSLLLASSRTNTRRLSYFLPPLSTMHRAIAM